MKRSSIFILFSMMIGTAFALYAQAENPSGGVGTYNIGVRGVYAVPIGSLSDVFTPAEGIQVFLGQKTEDDLVWEGVVEALTYSKGNTSRLYFPDLKVKLSLLGAGAQLHYYFAGTSQMVQPFVSGGAVLYRWFSTRGEHLTDSTVTVGADVPALDQNDWSFGFNAGVGADIVVMNDFAVTASVRYDLVVAEMWPALALHFENVSGFQSLQAAVGLKYEFEF